MGRALYRESGPSQDGDPDTGNLPFFFFLIFLFSFTFLIFFFFRRFVSFLILYLAFKQSTYNGDLLSQISWDSGACQFSFSFHLFIYFFFLVVYLLFSFDISLIVYVECRYNLIYIFFGVQFLEIHR